MSLQTYDTLIAFEQGGDNAKVKSGGEFAIESGGLLSSESGGIINIENGGALQIGGVDNTEILASQTALTGATIKRKKISVPAGDYSTVTDLAWDITNKMLILDVWIDVQTAQAAKTVDIGIINAVEGGDEDGFADGLSLASLGLVKPAINLATPVVFYNTTTRGAYLRQFVQGADADDRGLFCKKYWAGDGTQTSVCITTNTAITAVFDIWFLYIELD